MFQRSCIQVEIERRDFFSSSSFTQALSARDHVVQTRTCNRVTISRITSSERNPENNRRVIANQYPFGRKISIKWAEICVCGTRKIQIDSITSIISLQTGTALSFSASNYIRSAR